MDAMEPRVGAIGHSHLALWFHREGEEEPSGELAKAGLEQDVSRGQWLLNPGGVGQPRDGDPRAAWLLLDTGEWSAQWRRVEYPDRRRRVSHPGGGVARGSRRAALQGTVRLRTTTTLVLAAIAGLAAGCGSDDESIPIPADSASDLARQLDSIESRFQTGGGACGDITGGLDPNQPAVQSAIDSLPQDVDPDVRQALQDGFDRLFTLTDEQCDETEGQESEPEPVPEPEPQTETETIPTIPETETETVPTLPEESPIEPVPPEEEEPSGDDGSGGAVIPEGEG